MAFSGNQVTRLGLYGGSRSPYGSFAGKTAQDIVRVPGLEYIAEQNRGHFIAFENRGHFTVLENRVHYRARDED